MRAGRSAAAKNAGLAECYFMRDGSHYFITLNWGPVSHIMHSIQLTDHAASAGINLGDIWTFMIHDLAWATQN